MMQTKELRRIFKRERQRFADFYESAKDTGLVVIDAMCPQPPCRPRDYALADLSTRTIYLSRRALTLTKANIVGLLRHELGHIVDDSWAPGAEQRADNLAELVTGSKIRYDSRDVQTTGRGQYPRPRHLPR